MNENVIEFSAPEVYLKLNKNFPKPIKVNIPEWFKSLKHSVDLKTVKGCVPFLETLTTGYVLELPQDFFVKINVQNKKERITEIIPSIKNNPGYNVNIRKINDTHPTIQLNGYEKIKKNLNFPVFKIINPWTIKTPLGYSCLFLPPMNNSDDRFEIIPGIVNTDKFKDEINFPVIFNGDKYPIQETILKEGTPYVQIIPFKRESWKLKINKRKKENYSKHITKILHFYKTLVWRKVSWK